MYYEIKSILRNDTVFYSLVIILVAIISFGLGRLSVVVDTAGRIQANHVLEPIVPLKPASGAKLPVTASSAVSLPPQALSGQAAGAAAVVTDTTVIASKSGTKYHYPWCPGAKQIKETNRISFATPLEARASGYTPAANCPGLE